MSRIVSGDNAAEAEKASVCMVVLAELDFGSGIVRVHAVGLVRTALEMYCATAAGAARRA